MSSVGNNQHNVTLQYVSRQNHTGERNTYSNIYRFSVDEVAETVNGSMRIPSPDDEQQDVLFEIVPPINEDISQQKLREMIALAECDAQSYRKSAKAVTQILGGAGVVGAGIVTTVAIDEYHDGQMNQSEISVVSGSTALILIASAGFTIYFRKKSMDMADRYLARVRRLDLIREYLGFERAA